MAADAITRGCYAALVLVTIPTVVAFAEPPKLDATATKADTKITVSDQPQATTIDITCPVGIDRATLRRRGERWPQSVVIRLRLKGLESFEAAAGPVTLVVAVSSTGPPQPTLSLKQNGQETALDLHSPYWTDVKLVGEKVAIPLEGGYFEIPLPTRLFEANPPSIELRWVDFYRN